MKLTGKVKKEIKVLKREIKEIKESLGIKTKLPDDYTGWVVDSAFPKWMVYCVDGVIKYGFSVHGSWFKKSALVTFSDSDRPATKEEVEQRLKAEAERRGFVKGSKFKCLLGGFERVVNEIIYRYDTCHSDRVLDSDIGLIFKDGKWAEIIEQPKLNNIAVENLTRETGKEIIRLFQKLGVDTGCLVGNCNKSEGCSSTYYGVINGWFDCYSIKHCQENNIKIITIDQLRELAVEKEKTFPRMMMVRDHDVDIWSEEKIEFIYNGLAWTLGSNSEIMCGYKQFKEIN